MSSLEYQYGPDIDHPSHKSQCVERGTRVKQGKGLKGMEEENDQHLVEQLP